MSIISFIESELKRRNLSLAVVSQNNTLINQLKAFGKIKTFSHLTYENIIDFNTHLRTNGLGANTAQKRHSLFRGYIREAINIGKSPPQQAPLFLSKVTSNSSGNCPLIPTEVARLKKGIKSCLLIGRQWHSSNKYQLLKDAYLWLINQLVCKKHVNFYVFASDSKGIKAISRLLSLSRTSVKKHLSR